MFWPARMTRLRCAQTLLCRAGPAIAFILACGTPLACGDRPPPSPPNVLLITVDTLRPDYLSFNGYDRPTSPFVDELLAQGFYFEQAVAPVGRTTPSLASLLTGAYPHRTGVRTLFDGLEMDVTPMAKRLGQDGYQTLAVVTNSILGPARRLKRGFDRYDYAADVRTAEPTTDAALGFLEEIDASRPLFAWVHYIEPHVAYHSEPELARAFDPGYEGPYRDHFGWQPRAGEPPGSMLAYPEDLPKSEATHRNQLPDEVNAHIRRLYAADIRWLDPQIERLVSSVRERFGDNLIIVFTSDHGESLGEHDFYFDHGDYAYNASIRVPLALILPSHHPLAGRGRCQGWVSLVDVFPTLLELLGIVPGPELAMQLEGRSLTACMRGEALAPEPVFAESGRSFFPQFVPRRIRNDVEGRFRAVILGDWKLIWTPFQSGDLAWELYDLRDDPDETRNLYRPDHPELPRLRAELDAWLARAREQSGFEGNYAIPEQDRETLRALGYLE